MNQELLDAIKRRKQKLGGDEEPEQAKKEQKDQPMKPVAHGENFNKNKAMLQGLFGKKNQPAQ